jgi:hypothetical protein
MRDAPGSTRDRFLYTFSRKGYEKDWGTEYQKPGIVAKILAFFFRLTPRFGPLKALSFRAPTSNVERLFLASFDATITQYRELLDQAATGRLRLSNGNFDTGEATKAGSYERADRTYAKLFEKLSERGFDRIPTGLRQDILAFYRDPAAPIATKKDHKKWASLVTNLRQLEAARATSSTAFSSDPISDPAR